MNTWFFDAAPWIRRGRRAQVALLAIGTVACGNSDGGGTQPELPGSISVSTETSGFDKDDSYELLVDGVTEGTIGANDVMTVGELDPATYDVALGDVADNCNVEATSATVVSSETAAVTLTVVCVAGDPVPYSIRANRDRPDLETGVITECSFGLCPTEEGWDLYVQFNSAADPQAVVRQNQTTGVQIAHLPGVSLGTVTEADVAGAVFTTEPVNDSFGTDRVILIKTDTGSIYALGNPVENTILLTLAFDALLLSTGP
jgi:hypothetical protein